MKKQPKPKFKPVNKPEEYGKHRVCSNCHVEETETLQVIDIVLSSTLGRRSVCKSCLQVMINYSIERMRMKLELINKQQ